MHVISIVARRLCSIGVETVRLVASSILHLQVVHDPQIQRRLFVVCLRASMADGSSGSGAVHHLQHAVHRLPDLRLPFD
jgi:hypothetical protein